MNWLNDIAIVRSTLSMPTATDNINSLREYSIHKFLAKRLQDFDAGQHV